MSHMFFNNRTPVAKWFCGINSAPLFVGCVWRHYFTEHSEAIFQKPTPESSRGPTAATACPHWHGSHICTIFFGLTLTVSARIDIFQRVPQYVTIAIEGLRISRARHDGIRTQQSPYLGRVKACSIVINSQPRDFSLTGEQHIGIDCPCGETRLAVGIVALLAHGDPAGIGHDTG